MCRDRIVVGGGGDVGDGGGGGRRVGGWGFSTGVRFKDRDLCTG